MHLPGHFEGSSGLLWKTGPRPGGSLFPGDAIQIGMDRRIASFMWSYPNAIPLGRKSLAGLKAHVEPLAFSDLYGSFDEPTAPAAPVRRPGPDTRAIAPGQPFDVVVFWKQNDSGIYGRRQDRFVEHLRRSDRVGTIVHFDEPMSFEMLVRTWQLGRRSPADQRRLVAANTARRAAHRADEPGVHRHTFVFGGRRTARLGLPPRDRYLRFVQRTLRRHDVGTGRRPLVVWAYPANTDLPGLIDALAPDVVISDVVDDNRSWYPMGSPDHDRIDQNYDDVLARSDLVLANCEPVAASMARFTDEVHVVPNACDPPDDTPLGPRPALLHGISSPVLAYVGNLSSRLDVDLLGALSARHPEWQFAFVGSTHLGGDVLRLEGRPNVHFLGVRPYAEAHELLRHVDVALIPHLDDEMTRSMNPLKAFVYASAGVPIVATPIANLPDLDGELIVAAGVEGFEAAIAEHLRRGRIPVDPELIAPHTWDRRVAQVLDLIDGLAPPS